jgi:hypothetical protein
LSTPATLHSFPKLSSQLRDKFNVGILALRPFGSQIEDLDIDFNTDSSPTLITKLISYCSTVKNQKVPEDYFFWNLTIGQRIECLVKIALTDDSPFLETVLQCQEKGCTERFELRLSYENIFSQHVRTGDECDTCTVNIFGNDVQLRRPTGFDQLSWQKLDHTNQIDVLKHIVTNLVSDNSLLYAVEQEHSKGETIQQIGNKMSEIDPLIDYKIKLECPYCKIENLYEVNLEKLSLRKLRRIQRDLLYMVHEIAFHYHWTEKQVLAIPDVRRKLYLSMIETDNT